jgi:hypothetical protein
MAGTLVQGFFPGSQQRFVISGIEELSTLFRLYSLGFVGIFLIVAMMYRHAHARRQELHLDATQAFEARTLFRHYLIFVAVGLLSILLAWWQVGLRFGIPGHVYVLLGPFCALHGRRREKEAPKPS